MVEERPLLEGPAPLLVLLALGSLGVLEEHVAVNLALWVGAGLVNGMFGFAIVALEVFVH
jgi:hypothetical protein